MLAAAAVMAIGVTIVVGLGSSSRWLGRTFPGFFVLPNRVIASIGLMGWSATADGVVYQRTVLYVNGQPVRTSSDVYGSVAGRVEGAPIAYALRHGSATEQVTLATRTFSRTDYVVIFGSYLATGMLYLLVGLAAAWLHPRADLGRALLLVGAVGGTYALSAAGIYEPGADLRLHALAESFLPATLVHLGLVLAAVPAAFAIPATTLAWWLAIALAIPYQLVLDQPGAYSLVHRACESYVGVAGLGLGALLVIARTRAGADAPILLRSALAGAILGLGVPAVLFVLSGLSGGAVPVNLCTATAFLFPALIGVGLAREQLAPHTAPART
jgi:hypothetical protein